MMQSDIMERGQDEEQGRGYAMHGRRRRKFKGNEMQKMKRRFEYKLVCLLAAIEQMAVSRLKMISWRRACRHTA